MSTTYDIAAEYRAHQLWVAQCFQHDARAVYANATTKKAKREAAEDIEFWGNKAAMLANAKGWA